MKTQHRRFHRKHCEYGYRWCLLWNTLRGLPDESLSARKKCVIFCNELSAEQRKEIIASEV